MRYASVCDGIGAAHAAWVGHLPGWGCAWTSEIEPFPAAVVEARYGFPNLGDMLKITQEDREKYGPVDLLVGGTPCQSFSVAGLRGGLADARGNLALRFSQLASVLRPRWLVWENVPGVLSSGGGRDFGSILGAMADLGYGVAYRVLDAQYFGLAQRRKRVFVVGCLGDWRRAAAVLFERSCLRGDSAPGREMRADVANAVTASLGSGGPNDNDAQGGHLIAHCLNAGGMRRRDYKSETFVAHALRAERFDASEDGTGRGTPIVPFDTTQITSKGNFSNPQLGDPCHPLAKGAHAPAIAYSIQERAVSENLDAGPQGKGYSENVAYTIESMPNVQSVASSYGVRRLTPRECERLQGFPDNYTLIDFKGKPASDGPRYAALGNSMAVPVMRWIGERISRIDKAEFSSVPLTREERMKIKHFCGVPV